MEKRGAMSVNWETGWLEGRRRLSPDRIAVVDGETGRRWSYDLLYRRSVRVARTLSAMGISRGDRVAFLSPNDASVFAVIFACERLGAVFVPLNWRLSPRELNGILEDAKPKVLAFHRRMEHLAAELSAPAVVPYERLDPDFPPEPEEGEAADYPSLSAPAMILYTGGTTGKPKGVVLTHGSIFWNSVNTILSWQLTAKDRALSCLPMFHTGGLNALSIPVLHAGGTLVIIDRFDPDKVMDVIEREGCTIALMVPTMYHQIIRSPRFADKSFPTMREFLSGGAPCPREVYQSFAAKGLPFREGYGLTEAGPNNFVTDPSTARRKPGTVGKPMIYNQVRIVSEDGTDAPTGSVGEIWLRGGHLFDRYWNNSGATAEALVDGWLKTGDLGMRDEEGDHYIVGRKKEMIVTGGENVYPAEVEQLIADHPEVEQAVVVGAPDSKWGEAVVAVVVPKEGSRLTDEGLRSHLRGKLASYKIPKSFRFIGELPKTPVGKIDKRAVLRLFAQKESSSER